MAGRAILVAGLTLAWPLAQVLDLVRRFDDTAMIDAQNEIGPYVLFGFLSGTFLNYTLRRAETRTLRNGVIAGFLVSLPVAWWACGIGQVALPPYLGVPLAGLIAQFACIALGRVAAGMVAAR
jgi:hypothetical protein